MTKQEITLEYIISTYSSFGYKYEDYLKMSNEQKIKFLEEEYIKSELWIKDLEQAKEMYRENYKKAKDKLTQIKRITK